MQLHSEVEVEPGRHPHDLRPRRLQQSDQFQAERSDQHLHHPKTLPLQRDHHLEGYQRNRTAHRLKQLHRYIDNNV